jgi:hypothetical protein
MATNFLIANVWKWVILHILWFNNNWKLGQTNLCANQTNIIYLFHDHNDQNLAISVWMWYYTVWYWKVTKVYYKIWLPVSMPGFWISMLPLWQTKGDWIWSFYPIDVIKIGSPPSSQGNLLIQKKWLLKLFKKKLYKLVRIAQSLVVECTAKIKKINLWHKDSNMFICKF